MHDYDHRKLGQDLDLFHWQEEAPGMVFWHPRGFRIYRALEEAVRRHMAAQGIDELRSPQLLRQSVWERSGHWQAFRDNMFLLEEDERPAALKPVSCPAHLMLAKQANLSHHDLPFRVGELGLVHRNEQSGALHGLFRLRQFVQDDGHILCREDQVVDEVRRFSAALASFYAAFGFHHVEVAFASRPEERLGDDQAWDRAEAMLAEAARLAGLEMSQHPGEGAFYGPKLEFVLSDRLGRAWQCGTIQLDLQLAERFDVSYVGADGKRHRPVVLHRAVLGSLERFLGIVLEQHGGRLPAWLAPDQVAVLPVSDAQAAVAEEVARAFEAAGLRVRVVVADSLGRRLRDMQLAKVPFMAIVGAREAAAGLVALRQGAAQRGLALADAVAAVKESAAPPLWS